MEFDRECSSWSHFLDGCSYLDCMLASSSPNASDIFTISEVLLGSWIRDQVFRLALRVYTVYS